MRTAVIEAACHRFDGALSSRLGGSIVVRTSNVSFDSQGWTVLVRASTSRGRVDLRLAESHPAPFAWSIHGPPELVARVRPAFRQALEDSSAVTDGLRSLRRDVAPREHSGEPLTDARASGLFGADGALFGESIDVFARHYGTPLQAVRLSDDELPSIRFPVVAPEQGLLMRAPRPFRRDAYTIGYLEDLGFLVDADGWVATVPLPAVFARRRSRLEQRGGLRPELRRLRTTLFSARAWLSEIVGGVLPVNVNGSLGRGLAAAARTLPIPSSTRAYLNNHFNALGHDLGLHGLAWHRIPRGQMAELRRLARVGLTRGRRVSLSVAGWFEERLTAASLESWAEAATPTEFEDRFATRFPALRYALAREVGLA